MRNFILVIVFIIKISVGTIAQNLIPNPSFEEVTKITNRWSGTFSAFNRHIKYWDSSTQGSPDISQRRADSIKDYLIKKGIAAERITATGYGNQYPIISNDTEENRKINRRVEIRVEEK